MIINKGKKGELTTEQIVLIIILVVSFAIILFFLLRLNLGKTSDAETCHNSVATRAAGLIPKQAVPLNCKTRYLCISKDGTCDNADITIEKAKSKEEVYSILANQMADCWWMFGEGKLDYLGGELESKLYCSICSQVAFSSTLSSFFPDKQIDRRDFYNYLLNTNVSGKEINYLQYLFNDNYPAFKQSLKDDSQDFGKIDLSEYQFIVMGQFSKLDPIEWSKAGAGGLAGAVILLSIGAIVSGGTAIPAYIIMLGAGVGGGTGYIAGTIFQGGSGKNYLSPTIVEAESEAWDSLQCKKISTIG